MITRNNSEIFFTWTIHIATIVIINTVNFKGICISSILNLMEVIRLSKIVWRDLEFSYYIMGDSINMIFRGEKTYNLILASKIVAIMSKLICTHRVFIWSPVTLSLVILRKSHAFVNVIRVTFAISLIFLPISHAAALWIGNSCQPATTNLVVPILITSLVCCILSFMSRIKSTSSTNIILTIQTIPVLRTTVIFTSCSSSVHKNFTHRFRRDRIQSFYCNWRMETFFLALSNIWFSFYSFTSWLINRLIFLVSLIVIWSSILRSLIIVVVLTIVILALVIVILVIVILAIVILIDLLIIVIWRGILWVVIILDQSFI